MARVVKFTVVPMPRAGAQTWQIVGHYDDGRNMVWGEQTTERGVNLA